MAVAATNYDKALFTPHPIDLVLHVRTIVEDLVLAPFGAGCGSVACGRVDMGVWGYQGHPAMTLVANLGKACDTGI